MKIKVELECSLTVKDIRAIREVEYNIAIVNRSLEFGQGDDESKILQTEAVLRLAQYIQLYCVGTVSLGNKKVKIANTSGEPELLALSDKDVLEVARSMIGFTRAEEKKLEKPSVDSLDVKMAQSKK